MLVLFSLFALSLLAVGVTAVFPPKCSPCHEGPKAKVAISTEHSVHKNQRCTSCHAGKSFSDRLGFGAQVMYSMYIPVMDSQNFDNPATFTSRCQNCHNSLGGVLSNNGLNINHSTCAVSMSCAQCHGTVGHTIKGASNANIYTMDKCYTCHKSINKTEGCSLCHAGKSAQTIKATSSWKITHGPNWQKTHGMGNLNTCSVCHASSMCAKCHGVGVPHGTGFFGDHGTYAMNADQKCETCHAKTFCSDCHSGYEMPHPKGFFTEHDKIATTDTDKGCLVCHSSKDCTDCHAKHIHPGGAQTAYQKAKGGK